MNLKKRLKQKKYYILLTSSYIAFILISLCIGIWYYSNIKSSTSEIVLNYNQSMGISRGDTFYGRKSNNDSSNKKSKRKIFLFKIFYCFIKYHNSIL